jgi:hypothetical protein
MMSDRNLSEAESNDEGSVPDFPDMPAPRGGRFGAAVGLLYGFVAGAFSCWGMGEVDWAWLGALIGSCGGAVGGAIIARRLMNTLSDRPNPDIASLIGFFYGLFPSAFLLLAGDELVVGGFRGIMWLGVLSAGPMGFFLTGAILDRMYDAWLTRAAERDSRGGADES